MYEGATHRLQPRRAAWSTLAELVDLERRCCPFLRFRLSLDEKGAIELYLSGEERVQYFLAVELGFHGREDG